MLSSADSIFHLIFAVLSSYVCVLVGFYPKINALIDYILSNSSQHDIQVNMTLFKKAFS